MMILPLADALQNCFQNLTSRIAGMDSEQMTGRVMGMGAMLGSGLGAIKEQFRTPKSKVTNFSENNSKENNFSGNTSNGLSGFVARAKAIINPSINLSDEKDYNGNINPIRNVMTKENTFTFSTMQNNNKESKINTTNNKLAPSTIVKNVAKTGFNATKIYLDVGAKMAEGDFNKNSYNYSRNNKFKKKNNFQKTEFINKTANENSTMQKLGDDNEFNEKS